MKKLLLFLLFTIALNAQNSISMIGATCDNPIVIGSLPYQTTDNTANYGDTIDNIIGSCSGFDTNYNYFAGNDVYYKFTPAESGSINLKVSFTTAGAGISISIFDNCPVSSNNYSCLAGCANISASPRAITNFQVIAGKTYYILLSSDAYKQSYQYTLEIIKTLQGTICDKPTIISSLPYQVTDNTANYGDLYDIPQSTYLACGAIPSTTNYLAGNDVFYSFTATKDGLVSFKLTPTAINSSIFIYGDCTLTNTCLAGMANTSSNTRLINNFPVTAGKTYYVVISSSGATQTFGYTLVIQEEHCTPPSSLMATKITTTTAQLSWANPTSAIKWEVAVQPLGSSVPVTAGETVDTNPSYTKTGLIAGTQYQYFVRSVCDDGSFSSWAGPYLFNTAVCEDANKCNYTFSMTDIGGDGWNGATMQVKQNGIVVATIGSTFFSGAGPVNVTVPMCPGIPFELFWNNAGSAPTDCIVSIVNSFNQTLYTKKAGISGVGQLVYNDLVKCDAPVCNILPVTLTVTPDTHTASLSWNAPATSAWDVYLVPTGSPVPDASTVPTYSNVTTIPFSISGLIADNCYTFYVRTVCSPNPSAWSGGKNFCTVPTCPKPINLTVPTTYVTTNSAALYWTNGASSDTKWEILLVKAVGPNYGTPSVPATSPELSPGDIFKVIESPVTSPYTIIGLEQSTIYYYYIRTVCSVTDKSTWAGPIKFNTITCNSADKCNYTFMLTDTGKDGWNGGRMQVRQNGIVVYTFGSSITNGEDLFPVLLCNGVPFDIYWNIAGTKPQEIGFKIVDPFGDFVYEKFTGSGEPSMVLSSSIANCFPPTCPKPTALTVTKIKATEAILSWTENSSATQWEYFVVPAGSNVPVNGSPVNSDHIATTNPYTVTGLLPNTKYDFYIRALCSLTDNSTWTILEKNTFTTTPVNDECDFPIVVPVSSTETAIQLAKGNTYGATQSLINIDSGTAGSTADDIWYSFTAVSDKHVISFQNIQGGTIDLNHSVYSGNECENMTQLYYSNPNVSLATGLIPGNVYKIRVYTNGNNQSLSATFDIAITTPLAIINDECATAIPVVVNDNKTTGQFVSGSLTGATSSAVDNGCIGWADDDVWYSFVAKGSTQKITLTDVTGTITDLNHAVYSGDCSNLTQVYCSGAAYLSSKYDIYNIGQTYFVRVWSNSSTPQVVNFNLNIQTHNASIQASTTQYSTEELVTKVLMNNPCIEVSNVTSSTGSSFNSVNGIGYFNTPVNSNFPIAKGLVLSTGNVTSVKGPNTTTLSEGESVWTGDADLEAIILAQTGSPMNSRNASKLEFDFIAQNDFMSFNFLFASEEYGGFQCNFSDSFAFLLTDKTTNTTTNLAVVPGTNTPVSVVTIRDNKYNGVCSSENQAYFDNYYGKDGQDPEEAPTNFNGITKLMTASSAIIPGNAYHIKLVVADRSDSLYDSAVFIQGGSFNSGAPECMEHFKLVAFNDANSNGVQDKGESNFNNGSFIVQKNNVGELTSISSEKGSYNLFESDPANVYDFSYKINQEYASYYSVAITNFNDLKLAVGSGTTTLYFPVTLTQGYKDVSVTVIPVSNPVPGGTYVNKVVYKNNGTIPASGTITFVKPNVASITNISENNSVVTINGFTYDFTNLLPNETRSIIVTLNLPDSVNPGEVLTATTNISAVTSQEKMFSGTVGNTFVSKQTVALAKASTNITEANASNKIQLENFSANDYLTYTICFQNTGAANAVSVRLEETLDSKLDIQSLRMLSASHNYVMEIVGDKVIWKLDYINLVGAPQSDELSRGYLTFKIKTLPGINNGTIIPNQAKVYFDGNEPVVTNTFNTEFTGQALATPVFESKNIQLFPNPTSDRVQIRLQNSTEVLDNVAIYDLLGHLVYKVEGIKADQSEISVGNLAKGVYLVEITTQNQFKSTQKLIVK